MADVIPNDRLIAALATDLPPVRRLWPPLVRAGGFLAVVLAIAALLAWLVPLEPIARRLLGAPDLMLAAIGSAATAVLATMAAFAISLPDRSRAWALLPLPAAALWIGASGLGCLRTVLAPASHVPEAGETIACLRFILGMSLPLSALLIVMLRRAAPLRPRLTAMMGGLAVASAAASLLWFVHPFDASATDLAVHVVAVGIVIGLNEAFGGRLLGR